MTNDKIRKVLLEAATAEIDKLLAWELASETMTLTDIEDKVLIARATIGKAMAQRVIELREERRGAAIPVNPQTGKRLHPKGRKKGG